MNLKDEKFLADLKAAIESGITEGWAFDGEAKVPYESFSIDKAMQAFIKVLEGETTTCESCHKTVPLEWAHVSVGEDALDFCPKCMVEILTDSPWIPIEEFELVDGEVYDIYSPIFGRWCNFIYHKEKRIPNPISIINDATHIMKRPADPEI